MRKISGVNHRTAVKAFEKAGFWIARESKHIIMTNGTLILTIPRHNPLNPFTLAAIVAGSGLTEDEFRNLL